MTIIKTQQYFVNGGDRHSQWMILPTGALYVVLLHQGRFIGYIGRGRGTQLGYDTILSNPLPYLVSRSHTRKFVGGPFDGCFLDVDPALVRIKFRQTAEACFYAASGVRNNVMVYLGRT